jgi:hypothetical protein
MEKIMEKGNLQNKLISDMAMGKCKNRQRKSYIAQTYCKYFQGGYGRP